jgi:signal transduction histidine kinase
MITRKIERVRNRATPKSSRAIDSGAAHGSKARMSRSGPSNNQGRVADLEAQVVAQAEELRRAKVRLDEEAERRCQLELRFLEICERERRRFGQDLHDDTCQTLGGLAWIASKAGHDAMKRDPESARLFSAMAKELNDALEQAYRIAQGLHPAILTECGLVGALGCLAERVNERIPCVFEASPALPVPEAAELAFFRIAQEAVANAIKHSGASRISITARMVGENLVLSVEDDGRGLDPAPRACRGMGRDIMEYRARAIGAELSIHSRKGRGTLVQCVLAVPVNRR